jgi:hypothetical protein
MQEATHAHLQFLSTELPRFEACGAWERAHIVRYVSRIFRGANHWRLIIDPRKLNMYCSDLNMTCETLKHMRHLTSCTLDYVISLDLADGCYTRCIIEENRDYFIVNYVCGLWRLARLRMGWSGSTYYFCKLTLVFTNHLRRFPSPTPYQ